MHFFIPMKHFIENIVIIAQTRSQHSTQNRYEFFFLSTTSYRSLFAQWECFIKCTFQCCTHAQLSNTTISLVSHLGLSFSWKSLIFDIMSNKHKQSAFLSREKNSLLRPNFNDFIHSFFSLTNDLIRLKYVTTSWYFWAEIMLWLINMIKKKHKANVNDIHMTIF